MSNSIKCDCCLNERPKEEIVGEGMLGKMYYKNVCKKCSESKLFPITKVFHKSKTAKVEIDDDVVYTYQDGIYRKFIDGKESANGMYYTYEEFIEIVMKQTSLQYVKKFIVTNE